MAVVSTGVASNLGPREGDLSREEWQGRASILVEAAIATISNPQQRARARDQARQIIGAVTDVLSVGSGISAAASLAGSAEEAAAKGDPVALRIHFAHLMSQLSG